MKAKEQIKNQEQNEMRGQDKILSMINDKIIAKLEKGVNPWRKPWAYPSCKADATNVACNYLTGKAYNGINAVLLDAGYYLTFNEVQKLGGKIKKGAKGEFVIYSAPKKYYTKVEVKDDNGNVVTDAETGEIKFEWQVKKGFILKYYYVYRLEDCEDVREIKHRDTKEVKNENEDKSRLENVDKIVYDYCERCGVNLKITNSDRACYSPWLHQVITPKIEQFNENTEFYSTLFHELTHSTGHKKLLARDGVVNSDGFGQDKYAYEELIAEIGSCYCTNYLGLENDETLTNSVAYLQGWAKRLRQKQENTEDKNTSWFILSATSKAAAAFKLIMNIQDTKEEETQEQESEAEAE